MNPNAPAGHPLYVRILELHGRPTDPMLIYRLSDRGFAAFPLLDFPSGGHIDLDGRDFGPAANDS